MSLAVIRLSVREISTNRNGREFWRYRRYRLRMQEKRAKEEHEPTQKFFSHCKSPQIQNRIAYMSRDRRIVNACPWIVADALVRCAAARRGCS